jgi:DNA-binding IclR family transcriptional regulator
MVDPTGRMEKQMAGGIGERVKEPKNENGKREYSAPAVDRALDILEFMAAHPRPFGATELSRILKVPLNSTFRILKRLTDRDYTVQDPVSGGYQLSTRVFSLGMSLYTRFELRQRARPHLEWLCRETQETCQIQVAHRDQVLVLDTVSPEVSFYLRVVPGSLVYYHPNAFGKAMLAFMPEDEIKKILPPKLPALTRNTVTLLVELLPQLEKTRQTGLAYDNEEYTSGIVCIGSPVFDVQGNIAAGLGITAIASMLDKVQKGAFEKLVLECACRVSKSIGYSGDFFDDKIRA